jgi:hypothetical protein
MGHYQLAEERIYNTVRFGLSAIPSVGNYGGFLLLFYFKIGGDSVKRCGKV